MVDIPAHMCRLTLSGQCNLSRDTWNIVNWLQGHVDDFNDADLRGIAHSAFDAFNDNLWSESSTTGYFNDSTNLVQCVADSIDTSGHLSDRGIYAPTDPVSGGHSGALPSEVSICCTLEGDRPGRSYRGRMYLPGIAPTVLTADGIISTAATEALATQCAAYFTALAGITYGTGGTFGLDSGVLSRKLGVFTPMASVRVGNIMDVQVRRRNGSTEEYSSATVTGEG